MVQPILTKFSEQVTTGIIYDSRCGISDVAFHTAPPIGGLLVWFISLVWTECALPFIYYFIYTYRLSDEAGKVSPLQPFRGCLGDGVKYIPVEFSKFCWLFLFFTDFLLCTRTGRTGAKLQRFSIPRHAFPWKEVPFVGLVDIWPFIGISWAKQQFGPIKKKTANKSKTVRDREKVTK